MYCLMINNLYFYRKKNDKIEVITFSTPKIAKKCIEMFIQYSVQRAMSENGMQDPFLAMEIVGTANNFEVLELPEEIKNVVSFEHLLEEKGIKIDLI